jgi:D-amino-acid oxidase
MRVSAHPAVAVVGAGIAGLTAAWRLAEAGYPTRLVADAPPLDTTSAIAAALWYPYRAYPQDLVARWSAATFDELVELSAVPGTGVRMRWGDKLFREPAPQPWWRAAVPTLRRIPPDRLPPSYVDGLRMSVPVVDMPLHLTWLLQRLGGLGVSLEVRRLSRLEDAPGDIVVNCTGIGARALLPDPGVVPVRGQVVLVEQFGLSEWLLDEGEELTYLIPREETVVLGGTAQEGDDRLAPDAETARAIVERCALLVPAAARARILAHRVGLRPTRPAVRLERAALADGRPVVHCYGHGGSGVTLSYGCARDVVRLVSGPPAALADPAAPADRAALADPAVPADPAALADPAAPA